MLSPSHDWLPVCLNSALYCSLHFALESIFCRRKLRESYRESSYDFRTTATLLNCKLCTKCIVNYTLRKRQKSTNNISVEFAKSCIEHWQISFRKEPQGVIVLWDAWFSHNMKLTHKLHVAMSILRVDRLNNAACSAWAMLLRYSRLVIIITSMTREKQHLINSVRPPVTVISIIILLSYQQFFALCCLTLQSNARARVTE